MKNSLWCFKAIWLFAAVAALSLLPAAHCPLPTARADDWPQWLGPKRDGVWRETDILDKFPEKGPTVRWRTPIGAGYAGPAVVKDRVYVTDRILDQGKNNPKNPFSRDLVNGKERIVCLEESSGKVLWKHDYNSSYEISYAAGPRATPLVHDGKVYALGAMGELTCLDAEKGKLVWSKNFIKEYKTAVPMWGFAAHPLIDGDKLICLVGGNNSVVVAFNKDNGKEIWKSLSGKDPGYCPPMIYEIGGKRQLVIWYPDAVAGLDPETGKVYWSHPWRIQSALSIPTPRVDGTRVFLTSFYNGATMLDVNGDNPTVLWQSKWAKTGKGERADRTDNLHSIMPTPFIKDGYIYGICSYGELRCLKEETGERVWMSLKATGDKKEPEERWGNAFLVEQGDRFFIFNEKGDLIIAKLTPKGYEEISRANILKPDNTMPGRPVVWSHPAFANKCVFARNDEEIVCVSVAK